MITATDTFSLPHVVPCTDWSDEGNSSDSDESDTIHDNGNSVNDQVFEHLPTQWHAPWLGYWVIGQCTIVGMQLCICELRTRPHACPTPDNYGIGKVATILPYVHKSSPAYEMLVGLRRIQVENTTRWNSQLKSVRSLPETDISKLNDLNPATLTSYDRILRCVI